MLHLIRVLRPLGLLRLFGFGACLLALITASYAAAQRATPVNITSDPSGATVYVDSTEIEPIGVTPLSLVRAPLGPHTLIFRRTGFEDSHVQVNISKRGQSISATLRAMSVILINAAGTSAQGAIVRIDGESVGELPVRKTVTPGRHLVQIGRPGYTTLSEWMEVSEGQVLTIPAVLEREGSGVVGAGAQSLASAPGTGTIVVKSDVSGIPIFVDGEARGSTPAVVEGVAAGEHIVALRPSGPSFTPFTRSVTVVADQPTHVVANVASPNPVDTGSLRIITNVPGALISVDGEPLGASPAACAGLGAGAHAVVATAPGYTPLEQSVEVVVGRERVVSLRLQRVGDATGVISVSSNVQGAMVIIDGQSFGPVPVNADGISEGNHAIEVEAPGFRKIRRTCRVVQNRTCEIQATLAQEGSPVRVEANVPDAELYVDDAYAGPIPWEGDLAEGMHLVEVRARGYESHNEQVRLVEGASLRLIRVTLRSEVELTQQAARAQREQLSEQLRSSVSHSAATIPVGVTMLDLSTGWPYFAEMRMSTGVAENIDAGISVRSLYRLTDFEARMRTGWRFKKVFSAGLQGRVGGGIGPQHQGRKVNSFFVLLDALATLHFQDAGAFTLVVGMDAISDRWGFTTRDSSVALASNSRQFVPRLRLGTSLDIVISPRWNFFMEFEGIAAGSSRRIVGDVIGGNRDTRLYGRLGFTYKIGGN